MLSGSVSRSLRHPSWAGPILPIVSPALRRFSLFFRASASTIGACHVRNGCRTYDEPRWIGGLGMIGTKPVYNAVMRCDLLLMVGTDYPYSNFLPTTGTV